MTPSAGQSAESRLFAEGVAAAEGLIFRGE